MNATPPRTERTSLARRKAQSMGTRACMSRLCRATPSEMILPHKHEATKKCSQKDSNSIGSQKKGCHVLEASHPIKAGGIALPVARST